jgi:SAM-dependent methyltransferase
VTAKDGLGREYWNGPAGERWVREREHVDRELARITDALFALAAPQPGERAIDVGCGCGTTTIELARRTGAATLGVDVSAPMLGVARSRSTAASFVEADAATYRFTPDHALALSRFGVMFFADPIAAFANIKSALAPGGRLVFACWRPYADNPWAAAPLEAARALLPAEPPADPLAPGPFAFADAARVEDILARAGFRDVAVTALDTAVWLGDTLDAATDASFVLGPLARRVDTLDAATRAAIREPVRAALAAFDPAAIPAAAWLVRGAA